jgi:hypothetical protein
MWRIYSNPDPHGAVSRRRSITFQEKVDYIPGDLHDVASHDHRQK